jgi:type III pantothenate kinase
MAYGRPVVATSVGGLVDAVEDGVTGILVPPRDPAALRGAMTMLVSDPDLRSTMGGAGRQRAGTLAWTSYAEAVRSAYEDATGQD